LRERCFEGLPRGVRGDALACRGHPYMLVDIHVSHSLGSVVKVNSNTNTSSNMNSRYNMHLWWIRANSAMALFRGQACFNLWTIMQKTGQMDEKLLTAWVILPLPWKKLLCKHVHLFHWIKPSVHPSVTTYNTVHVILCPNSKTKVKKINIHSNAIMPHNWTSYHTCQMSTKLLVIILRLSQ
jgi:hypothetical protein